MNTASSDWLRVMEEDYLGSFIPEGGAAVKFVVADSAGDRRCLRNGLEAAAGRNHLQFAFVDAASTRIHLIDRLFHEVARQVDWERLIRAFLLRLFSESGLRPLSPEGEITLRALAEANDRRDPLFREEINSLIIRNLYEDYGLTQEFRFAMISLCQNQLDTSANPALATAIKEWLRGELRLVSAVKGALIYQKIGRHNARHMLFSLARWLRLTGQSGLVLVLDISRYADSRPRRDREDGLYYSSPAAVDAYEVLRQLVDATDELEYGFICVMADRLFLTDARRGLLPSAGNAYQALYMRIADEVRDRYRQNPLASLARLGDGP